MNSFCLASTAVLLAAVSSGSALAATVSSDFTANAEAWTVTTFTDNGAPNFAVPQAAGFIPTFVAVGGDPDGFIRIADPDDGWTYFIAPAAYRGDQSDKLDGTLSFSLQHSGGTLVGNPPHAVLKSGSLVLVADAGGPPALTPNWTRYTIDMVAANWHVGTLAGAVATDAELLSSLSALDGLFLSAEFITPVVETTGLDSVSLVAAPVPIPAAGWLLGSALLGLAARRRKA